MISHLYCTFSQAYDPGQYLLSIDETMIKSKGRAIGKVCMSKNQVKHMALRCTVTTVYPVPDSKKDSFLNFNTATCTIDQQMLPSLVPVCVQ